MGGSASCIKSSDCLGCFPWQACSLCSDRCLLANITAFGPGCNLSDAYRQCANTDGKQYLNYFIPIFVFLIILGAVLQCCVLRGRRYFEALPACEVYPMAVRCPRCRALQVAPPRGPFFKCTNVQCTSIIRRPFPVIAAAAAVHPNEAGDGDVIADASVLSAGAGETAGAAAEEIEYELEPEDWAVDLLHSPVGLSSGGRGRGRRRRRRAGAADDAGLWQRGSAVSQRGAETGAPVGRSVGVGEGARQQPKSRQSAPGICHSVNRAAGRGAGEDGGVSLERGGAAGATSGAAESAGVGSGARQVGEQAFRTGLPRGGQGEGKGLGPSGGALPTAGAGMACASNGAATFSSDGQSGVGVAGSGLGGLDISPSGGPRAPASDAAAPAVGAAPTAAGPAPRQGSPGPVGAMSGTTSLAASPSTSTSTSSSSPAGVSSASGIFASALQMLTEAGSSGSAVDLGSSNNAIGVGPVSSVSAFQSVLEHRRAGGGAGRRNRRFAPGQHVSALPPGPPQQP